MRPDVSRAILCLACLLFVRAGFGQDSAPVSAIVTPGTATATGSLLTKYPNAADHPSSQPLSAPLGLAETGDLLARAEALLRLSGRLRAAGDTTASLECKTTATRCVEMSRRYLEGVSRNQRGQIRCTWVPLGKSQPLEWNETFDRFPKSLRAPIRGAMALRFTPSMGVILLGSAQVRAADGRLEVYSLDKKVLPDLPKREVLYLKAPTEVVQVVLFMQNLGKETCRMFVEAGVPESPEYALELTALCGEALSLIRERNPDAAADTLLKARNRLNDFQASLTPPKGT